MQDVKRNKSRHINLSRPVKSFLSITFLEERTLWLIHAKTELLETYSVWGFVCGVNFNSLRLRKDLLRHGINRKFHDSIIDLLGDPWTVSWVRKNGGKFSCIILIQISHHRYKNKDPKGWLPEATQTLTHAQSKTGVHTFNENARTGR